MKRNMLLFFLLSAMLLACDRPSHVQPVSAEAPDLEGMLVWKTTLDDGVTGLSLYDFSTDKVVDLSSTWNMTALSGPSISPDGTKLAFAATVGGSRDIFLYDITDGKVPVNLTEGSGERNDEPRFSFDGKSLLFRRGTQIFSMEISSGKLTQIVFDPSTTYYTPAPVPSGSHVLYSTGTGSTSAIGVFDMDRQSSHILYDRQYVQDLAPVAVDDNSFYYVSGYSVDNPVGQVCKGYLDGSGSVNLPFNDAGSSCSCPSPVSGDWLIVSSDRNQGNGSDLYIANAADGAIFPMSVYNHGICTEADEDESCWCSANVHVAEPEDGGGNRQPVGDDITSDTEMPALKGRLVFHNYTSYDAMDSKMYIFDFESGELETISTGWTTVTHPMNGHFSPDGKRLTFMGIGNGNTWDVFVWDIERGGQPVNLTGSGDYRDEDPKFSFDGTRIAFKRNDRLAEIDMLTGEIRVLSSNDASSDPYSMPYYSTEGTKMVYGGGSGQDAYIGCWDIASSTKSVLYDRTGVVEYYPITIDAESFYYSAHVSETDNHDQLYKGFWDKRSPVKLAFNRTDADYSDACPVSSGWLVLCSTRSDSEGGYDLYIAHESSGAIYSLDKYNGSINTEKNELGASYCYRR